MMHSFDEKGCCSKVSAGCLLVNIYLGECEPLQKSENINTALGLRQARVQSPLSTCSVQCVLFLTKSDSWDDYSPLTL